MTLQYNKAFLYKIKGDICRKVISHFRHTFRVLSVVL